MNCLKRLNSFGRFRTSMGENVHEYESLYDSDEDYTEDDDDGDEDNLSTTSSSSSSSSASNDFIEVPINDKSIRELRIEHC